MPTYEYKCTKCGYAFEASQKMSDKPLEKCPKCQKKVNRLISLGGGIIFKGSGFYATDYRKKPAGSTTDSGKKTCDHAKEGCHSCPHAK